MRAASRLIRRTTGASLPEREGRHDDRESRVAGKQALRAQSIMRITVAMASYAPQDRRTFRGILYGICWLSCPGFGGRHQWRRGLTATYLVRARQTSLVTSRAEAR